MKKSHGGKRKGAGAKKKAPTTNLVTRVEVAHLKAARERHGNVNPQIRELIKKLAGL